MKPVPTDDTNFVYKMPPGLEGGDLPCRREDGRVISTWECEEDDLAGLSPEMPSIVLGIVTPNIVGCSIRVCGEVGGEGCTVVDDPAAEKIDESVKGGPIYWQYRHVMADHEVQLLRNGARVEIMVDLTPPPPVYVVLA